MTPYELSIYIKVYKENQQNNQTKKYIEMIYLAWHIGILSQTQKNYPSLESLISKIEQKKPIENKNEEEQKLREIAARKGIKMPGGDK